MWAAEMESLPSQNKNVKYLLCVIDIFTKYAWVKPLEDKKGKADLLWVDQERYFNDILMYSTHNEGKSVIAESL